MEPAPPGIDPRLAVAAGLFLYVGPAAGAVLGSPVRYEPVLQLLLLFGALAGVFSLLFPAFIALGLTAGNAEITPTDAMSLTNNRGALIVIDSILLDVCRVLMLALVVKCERFFRRAGNQVMYFSRVRMLPTAAAAGFGFGLLRGLCVVSTSASAAIAVSTTTTSAGFVPVAPASVGLFVDANACPSMPLLILQCAIHLMSLLGNTVWTVLWLPLVIAWFDEKTVAPSPTPSSTATTTAAQPSSATTIAAVASGGDKTQTAEAQRSQQQQQLPVRFGGYRISNITSPVQQYGLAAAALFTHLIFSCVSLVNSDAFDWVSNQPVSGRGCTVSLLVQAVCVLAAVLACIYAIRLERFSIPSSYHVDAGIPLSRKQRQERERVQQEQAAKRRQEEEEKHFAKQEQNASSSPAAAAASSSSSVQQQDDDFPL